MKSSLQWTASLLPRQTSVTVFDRICSWSTWVSILTTLNIRSLLLTQLNHHSSMMFGIRCRSSIIFYFIFCCTQRADLLVYLNFFINSAEDNTQIFESVFPNIPQNSITLYDNFEALKTAKPRIENSHKLKQIKVRKRMRFFLIYFSK